MNRIILILLTTCLAAVAAEPLKVWTATDLSDIMVWGADAGMISRALSTDVKTVDGLAVLEVKLAKARPEPKPQYAQLLFRHKGGLKTGLTYEVGFLCKASAPGEMQLVAALNDKPWTPLPGASSKVKLAGTEWQQVTLRITTGQDWTEPLALPRILLGSYGADATLLFGPVSLKQVEAKP